MANSSKPAITTPLIRTIFPSKDCGLVRISQTVESTICAASEDGITKQLVSAMKRREYLIRLPLILTVGRWYSNRRSHGKSFSGQPPQRIHTTQPTPIPHPLNHIPLPTPRHPPHPPPQSNQMLAWPSRSLLFSGIRARGTRGFVPGPSGLAAPETL